MEKYILDGQYGTYLSMIGVDVGEALRAAGVPEDLFSRTKPIMEEEDYYAFMTAVGSQITGPSLPITIATAENIETFSPPIFASYCSENGAVCLERLSRYKRLIAPMRYELENNGETGTLVIAASSDQFHMPQFLVESEMVFVLHILRSATKQNIVPVAVEMEEPVPDGPFEEFTECPVSPASRNVLTFRSEDLKIPFISYNASMWDFFEPELRKRLSEMEQDDSFAARVRSALTELLPGGAGSADDVAKKLGVSRRTLQRKLSEENTTFQKQLNGTRELLAKHYIRNTDMSSDDIAFLLGYQETNSFLRAFHLWTGGNVTEYKAAH